VVQVDCVLARGTYGWKKGLVRERMDKKGSFVPLMTDEQSNG
jgi:hypothetical protein